VLLVASVEVFPASGDLVLGGTAQLSATPRTASGLVVPGRAVSWSSSNAAAVSVSPAGVITAHLLGGPVRITATVDGVSGQAQITVQPFPIARIEIAPNQAGVPVGGSIELVATAYDAQGQPLPERIPFWTSSAPAIAAVTSTGIVLGMAEGGPVTITATAEGKAGTAVVTVTPRPATQLGFLQQPGSATAGMPISPAVRVVVRNDQGGTVTAATTAVTLALGTNPHGATLGGTTTVAAVNGIATFGNLTLDRAGTGYTLTASATGLAPATSNPFANLAGPPSQLVFTTAPPAAATSGQPLSPQPVLQLRDGFGNAVDQGGVVVTASVASGTAGLIGGASATTSNSGTASFTTLGLSGPGSTVTLAFSAAGLTPAVSAPITLTTPSATTLAIATQPSAAALSGVAFAVQPAVELRDGSGNKVSTAGVAITAALASGPAGGTLTGTTVAPTAGGTATFTNLAITGPAGSYTIQFTSPGLTPVTSNAVALASASASQLSITTQPSGSAVNGAAFTRQPVVQLRDGSGSPVAKSGVAVTAVIASGGGTLAGTTTINTDASGAAAFLDLGITGTVGDRTLRFSSAGLSSVTSGTITLTAGPPSQLGITIQPPSSAQNGVAFTRQPVVQLRDISGNAVSQTGVTVTATIGTGGGTLGGTLTATTDASGKATFTDLTITGTIGDRTLRFSAPGLTGVTSAAITITAGPAASLSITVQPTQLAFSGVAFLQQPVVQLRDASGNLVATPGVPVTVAINTGPGALNGNLTVNTNSSGAAIFSGLSITGSGTHTLVFTSGNLNQIVSVAIVVL
jgi:hypothetical protein